VACFANKQGEFGTKMLLIASSDGPVKKVEDIQHRRLTLTRPKSNSGCIAPLVLLATDYNMHLDKDFSFRMSQSHENSIRGVASGEYDVAAVTSDILGRMEAEADSGIKSEKINIIYESKTYPPGVLGIPHNLDPKIAGEIREIFANFDWTGTGLEATYSGNGSSKFAIVSYKDDWAVIRDIQAAAIQIATRAKN
jgi:phosphonate transport system substrate-binding protein